MSLNAQDNQAEKPKVTAPQTRAHSPSTGQSETSGEARRERKQRRRRHRKASPAKSQEDVSETNTSKANVSQAGEVQKEAKQGAPKRRRWNSPSRRNASKIMCYNCHKKDHYARYCTEPKD